MSNQEKVKKPKKQRWYLGGFAGAGAVLFTHPLDLLKVCYGFTFTWNVRCQMHTPSGQVRLII